MRQISNVSPISMGRLCLHKLIGAVLLHREVKKLILKNCRKIPLPPYRSNKQSDIILCKTCYLSLYKIFDCAILPIKTDIQLLDQIVFSCKFFAQGCSEEFSINSLENLLFP